MNEPRSILITGAAGKIGTRLTRHFVAAGDTVIAIIHRESSGRVLQSEIAATGASGQLMTYCVDLVAENGVDQVLTFLQQSDLHPTALINGARSVGNLELSTDGRPSRGAWIGEFLMGVQVPYELSIGLQRQAGSRLKAVVSLSSIYGLVAPNPALYEDGLSRSPVHYGVVKAALNHLTKELAVRLAEAGVRVNTVSFGGVRGRVDQAFESRYAQLCPAGHMLGENDITGAVDFLLSEAASAVTGHNLVVDGGWTAW
jgi:NAD(P)-dependent dehydrogenase (short-subunit alcohol dehydrogenase family)